MTTDILSEINENAILKITDVSGKPVHTQSLKLAEGLNNIKVDVGSNLPAGIYILHVTSLHTNKVVKIVKE
ncbi:MAG: T9SS type A sorting domain-containing protein [Bacteroidetes bacterium]|nr:T9SS type A sorting domain-containing protein [Bacteroidota bacterium]